MTGRPLRHAEIIAVGSELLGWSRLDTNSLFLAERLAEAGIPLRAKAVVGDSEADLGALFEQALSRSDLIILTGGLGPTDDDVTRDAVSRCLHLPLEEDPDVLARLLQRFERRRLRMPDVNRRQALVPRGATPLANPNGTAPGLLIDWNDHVILLLPGPPRELQPIFEAVMAGPLAGRIGPERLFRRAMFLAGKSESHIEEIIQPTYSTWRDATPPIDTTILASPGQLEIHLTTRSADEAVANHALDQARDSLLALLGDDVFSTSVNLIEEVVGALLRDAGVTIAAAESCTGGLLLSRLTDVAGSSAYVAGGVVAYSNEIKTSLVGVPAALIAAHGAVSEPVAIALADGIRTRTGANLGVGITGIAGPSGATPTKPVGTVCIALAGVGGDPKARTFSFPGARAQVKYQATQLALELVRRRLLRR